jgi:ABC-type transport system involved in multi-copper enzyme maturation permease subunit
VAGRVLRLTRVELMKLVRHPFFPFALVLLAAATLLGAWAFEPKTEVWRQPHALLMFAWGAKAGLKMASFLLVIFGSLSFAGEFDKGTIKLVLTRPVTRTDVFIAKSLTGLALAALFIGAVLALSFGFGCLKGELGPVWDSEQYLTFTNAEDLANHATRAVGSSIGGVVAAVFLGIAVSTLVESSGFAVAAALTLFIGMDLGLGFLREEQAFYMFGWYPSHALEILRTYAEGSSGRGWRSSIGQQVSLALFSLPVSVAVPAAWALACGAIGYVLFRVRNILA